MLYALQFCIFSSPSRNLIFIMSFIFYLEFHPQSILQIHFNLLSELSRMYFYHEYKNVLYNMYKIFILVIKLKY